MSIIQKMVTVVRTSGAFMQPQSSNGNENQEVVYIHVCDRFSETEEKETFCVPTSLSVFTRMLKVGDNVYLEWNSDDNEKGGVFSGDIVHVLKFSLNREVRGNTIGEKYGEPAWFKAGFGLL